MINPEGIIPEITLKKAEKLSSLDDLQQTIIHARLHKGLIALLKVFIDQDGTLLELTKNMAVELVMAGDPTHSESTYKADLFVLLIRSVNRAPNARLFFEKSRKRVAKDGRPQDVYRLSYRPFKETDTK